MNEVVGIDRLILNVSSLCICNSLSHCTIVPLKQLSTRNADNEHGLTTGALLLYRLISTILICCVTIPILSNSSTTKQ